MILRTFLTAVLFLITGLFIENPANAQSYMPNEVCKEGADREKYIEAETTEGSGSYYQAAAQDIILEEYVRRALQDYCATPEREFLSFEFYKWPILPYDGRECESKWNELGCKWEKIFRAPKGYQICRLDYEEDTEGTGKVAPTYQSRVRQGDRMTSKFREIKIVVSTYGNLFSGGRAKFLQPTLYVLPIDESEQTRRKHNCRIPFSGYEIDDEGPEGEDSDAGERPHYASDVSGKVLGTEGQLYEITFHNQSNYPSRMRYTVFGFDEFFGKEMIKDEGVRVIPPKQKMFVQVASYGTTDWRVEAYLVE